MKLYEILLLIIFILSVSYTVQYCKVETKQNEVQRQTEELAHMCDHVDSLYKILDGLPLGSPLDTVIVDDEFGIRRHPILKIWRRH